MTCCNPAVNNAGDCTKEAPLWLKEIKHDYECLVQACPTLPRIADMIHGLVQLFMPDSPLLTASSSISKVLTYMASESHLQVEDSEAACIHCRQSLAGLSFPVRSS